MVIKVLGRKCNLSRLIPFLYLFVCIWGIRAKDESNTNIYIVTAMAFLYTAFYILSIKGGIIRCPCRSNRVFLTFFTIIYIFGVANGYIHGNDRRYIIRNHSGMLMYLSAFILVNLKINQPMIKRLIKTVGIILTILTPCMYCLLFIMHYDMNSVLKIPLLNSFQTGLQELGYTIEYSGLSILFAIYAYAMYEFMYYSKLRFVLLMLVEAIIICLLTLSGGRLLELVMLTFFGVIGLNKSKPVGKNKLILITMLCIAIIATPALMTHIFGSYDGGNQIRYMQIQYILRNLSLTGHGLGATYSEIGKGYGIETIYLDLFYKLGIIAVPIIFIYIYSYYKSFKLLRKTDGDWIDIVPLAFMGYLWYSLGNPNLFSAGNVIIHIISMEIINARSKERVLFI